ncbi:MAG: hypothetical protein K2H49_00600 [Muribaculaceae bacterium]|nr:hypothetical protein [Muribaculaceae bacterium]
MWTLFKIINLWWLLTSTFAWPMLALPLMPLLVLTNAGMLISMSFLPIRFKIDAKSGWVLLAILGVTLWSMWLDGWSAGLMTAMQYLPALYLMQLPYEYLKDLLKFTTKWYAILLIPALLLYWLLLFTTLPSAGTFTHSDYPPYTNYIFYIKTTENRGLFERFNAFFLEPGHQAILDTFLIVANRFNFKKCPWLFVLVLGVIFSFSLAGYLLSAIGFILLKVNSLMKFLAVAASITAISVGAYLWSGGDNALNELIISRMERDESGGIKGNNRFFNNTDYEYDKAIGTKYFWIGVKTKANMALIGGAGYKIYILYYGMIGTILAFLLYLSLIPSRPDYRYTISFFILIVLCFLQRAYPFWYSWLFPFVAGIYIAKDEKDRETTTGTVLNQKYIAQ